MNKETYKFPKINKSKVDDMLKKVKYFEIRNSDVFLIGHLKSGTTWAQEMIWLILNNLDYKGAKIFVDERFPVLELNGYYCKDDPELTVPECHWNSLEFVTRMKDPRCIKTHLKWELLPNEILDKTKKPKIIYMARNPKDVCLSSYYYFRYMINSINCTLEEYVDFFLKGHIFADDRSENYWNHVLYFWERRNESNVLFIKYEDMKRNLANVIQKVAEFLEKPISNEQISYLVNWLDFESMKNNAAVNHESIYRKGGFMRDGKVGAHEKAMSSNMIEKFNSWIEENLKGTDYELHHLRLFLNLAQLWSLQGFHGQVGHREKNKSFFTYYLSSPSLRQLV
ncbi:hypothetical protein FQR65_LT08616 [Abscondita terminalis]|nr:hypothetical protein FQR65_LT08616 [Abscondita terminalis]